MKISEIAKLTGITVRTLHYYDEIGLFKPSEITESGYRIYSKDSLAILQQILFFRELDFPLDEIKEIMTNPNYDKEEALKNQRMLLVKKQKRLDGLINLIDDIIKGEDNMSFKEFDMQEIEESKKKYADEVKKRWGNTLAYKENQEKTKNYDDNKWKDIYNGTNEILAQFAQYRDCDPGCEIAQDLVGRWKEYITSNFYKCTDDILSCLGLMYVEDERFKNNIDKNGEGTAQFMSQAIKIYCAK